MTKTDPVELTAQLIRCPSVTPNEAGAIKYLEESFTDEPDETFSPDSG